MDRLIAFRDKQIIKVITGVRRCGKSTLLAMFQDYLREQGVSEEQILSINFEDYDFAYLQNPDTLHAYIKERLLKGKMTYIFLDEIQNVSEFQRVVDSIYLKKDVDIYLTGSNAYLLSGDIATLLSGRYVQIEMLPLSFREYVKSTGSENDLARKYTSYLESSSFPYALQLAGHPEQIRNYLDGVYSTIVVKDIAQRRKFSDPLMMTDILRYLFDNIGNTLSSKKIADTMTSNGRKIDVKTVEKYLDAFMESYIIYQARRYNIKGKQYLKTLEKYYVVDIGLRTMLLGHSEMDVGHILENVIYLELLRRGCKVFVGKEDQLEVDFVAMEARKQTYFQVAATARDEIVLSRELAPLRKIADHYPKFLLTLDEDPEADYDGIRRVNALDWLMNKTPNI